MGIYKRPEVQIVALATDLAAGNNGQGSVVRAMRIVAVGAILGGGRVKCSFPPILRHLNVTTETKSWLVLVLKTGMG
jgi:hypothetical protein